MPPTMDIWDVADFFATSVPTITRWVRQGILKPEERRRGHFASANVQKLLPQKLRDRDITLITTEVAAARARTSRNILGYWISKGVLNVVYLPRTLPDARLERRYVLEEIDQASRVPNNKRMYSFEQLLELGVPAQELRDAIVSGKLRSIARWPSPSPHYTTTAVRAYLVGRLYDTD